MAKKSKPLKDQPIVKIVLVCTIVFALTVISTRVFVDPPEPQYINYTHDFKIESYHVYLQVSAENVIEVTETIIVDWKSNSYHGIFKFTPEWFKYKAADGKIVKRKARLTNYRAVKDTYSLDVVKKKPRIKVGDPYHYVTLGPRTYQIKYTYDMGKDPHKGFDEFVFHAFGDYWEHDIYDASIEIRMPFDFNESQVSFWTDKFRENKFSYVDYYVSDNTLYAKSNLPLKRALTVDIELPDRYFTGGHNNYGFFSLLMCLLVFAISGWSYLTWRKYGKNLPKVPVVIEFSPPYDLDASQIGFVYGGLPGKKLAIALIIQLAAKGWIAINVDDKKNIVIENLYPLHDSDQIKKSGLMPEALTDNQQIVYERLFATEDSTLLKENKEFPRTFDLLRNQFELKNKINDQVANKKMIITALSVVVSIAMVVLAWILFEDLNPAFGFLYNAAFISVFITAFFMIIMGRRTEYGETLISKVEGFRKFLDKVEKDVLETLVEENPQYFYDILPYTYVLEISKKWIKKFENITMPENDMGNFDYSDTSSLNYLSDSIPDLSSGGSGCSSCGGGCSSCGGGCSSCGGGGSW